MKKATRRFLIVAVAAVGFLILSWTIIVSAVMAAGGIATVQLHERTEGLDLYVPIPMALVSAAASTAGFLAPAEAEHWMEVEGDLDLGEWAPFVDAVFEALEECPDATFVEVLDHGDLVRVAKRGGKIQVEVRDPDLSLRVAVPIRPIRRTVAGILG